MPYNGYVHVAHMEISMKQEVMAIWQTALLSGEYQQGFEYLNRGSKFCALGVLADIYLKEMGREWVQSPHYVTPTMTLVSDITTECTLTKNVLEWAGLTLEDCSVIWHKNDDMRMSFAEIAVLVLPTLNVQTVHNSGTGSDVAASNQKEDTMCYDLMSQLKDVTNADQFAVADKVVDHARKSDRHLNKVLAADKKVQEVLARGAKAKAKLTEALSEHSGVMDGSDAAFEAFMDSIINHQFDGVDQPLESVEYA